ncbi:glycosyltransferase [Enterobacter sp. RHBSTW-00901]|uniref:glycosyltransferase family 2 protein n=1 Tax=Enterobacter sp. RHBSTW-00901 TaxID=2742669 RepID=UPI0015F6AB5D|nr:glycosyltransferase [Enterobacter sp. RHBSTW-00901]MBA7854554.1 glycosyltransferase [Enterobacter sp. RHBSTW-00901]
MIDFEVKEIITVAVISYNSGNTIADTLNSIVSQTYNKNAIEVIIADDGSRDHTLSVAQQWKEQNNHLFNNIVIVTHEKNRGVAANCNQAWQLASGSWIKTIAADDLLLPNCIELNVRFISRHPKAKIVFSDMIPFTVDGKNTPIKHDKKKICANQQLQLKNILSECYLLAPTGFISKDVLEYVGYADESYPMIEDYPLWLKCLRSGFTLSYMEENTVLYRKGDSLSQQGSRIGNLLYLQSLYSFQKEKIWPLLPASMLLKKWDDFLLFKQKTVWMKIFGNKVTVPYLVVQKLMFLLRPYKVFNVTKKNLIK